MAQNTSGAAAGGRSGHSRRDGSPVDRLPMSFMAWEICLIVQIGWATSASTDGIAARLYPFIWLPAKAVTHSQYDVLYAFQAGISIVHRRLRPGLAGRQNRPPQGADRPRCWQGRSSGRSAT